MLHASLLTAAAFITIAQAAPNVRRDLETYLVSTQTCITNHRCGQTELATIPTSTRTSCSTVSQTFTTCGTSTITTTVTPEPVTSTKYEDEAALDRRQETISITITAAAQQACSTTTTVSEGVSTVYTGEYNATLARRTASPFDIDSSFTDSSLAARKLPLVKVLHRLGHAAFSDDQNAYEVDCLAQVTSYIVTRSTIQEEPSTSTVTAPTPTQTITIKNKLAVPITTTVVQSPPAASSPSPDQPSADGTCTTTAASVTTTQHLKCAPTNIISSLSGHGIGQTTGNTAGSRGLAPGENPSACCQLCMDTEGCAASENDPDAGNCFLWYTEPGCGLGFTYKADQRLGVGEGFWVQSGCGWVAGEVNA
ncbi:unnamed protein product [Zymoseptoria tritici ST99CH_1A5]|uniref:Apple domain-containing protein n=1 Tax=Zymoseptoria tritici ST99CH_1A5 TaxID=1276529 RepID=A0A1Y6LII8_ZYMTR|nr:unnamed protein product [Zymoseptoria tritici ST99CH_1A5]